MNDIFDGNDGVPTPVSEAPASRDSDGQGRDMPAFAPARTLREALLAAQTTASAELRLILPAGLPAVEIKRLVADGSAFAAANYGAMLELERFMSNDLLYEVTGGIAEGVVMRWADELSAKPGATPTLIGTLTEQYCDLPRQPLRPVDDAIACAFADVCEAYELNFPTGVPFESLNPEVHAIVVRRGRLIAFNVLEPSLPRAAAICMSEAIAEGAWHVCARELACPQAAVSSAIN